LNHPLYVLESRHVGVCKYEVMAACILQISLDVRETSVSSSSSLFNEEWTRGDHGHLGVEVPQDATGRGDKKINL